MDKALLGWLLLLGVGFPLVGLLLSEAAERLEKGQPLLASACQKLQRYVLPPLAVLLVMRRLLNIAGTEGSSRLVETATWIAISVAGIALVNAILTTQPQSSGWQLKVPNLFFQMLRGLVVLAIAYYIVSGVWAVDVTQFVTAVGVGSLAIALALQNTLSNLVSGLLLLVAKPFEVGDWISFDGSGARVIDQSWWSVTVDNGFAKRIIPNSALSGASISNLGKGPAWTSIRVGLSYDDPPNVVLAALSQLPEGIKEIEAGSAFPAVSSYDDSSIQYDLWFLAVPGMDDWLAKATLLSRFYYMVQREGFTIPYPIGVEYAVGINPSQGLPSRIPQVKPDRSSDILRHIQASTYFASLDLKNAEAIAQTAKFSVFGSGETIIQEGKAHEGFYLIANGCVRIWTQNQDGFPQAISSLGRGEGFGELSLFPGELSPITVIAEDDVELVVIREDEMVQAFQSYPRFGVEMMRLIDEKRHSINLVKGIAEGRDDGTVTNGSSNGAGAAVQSTGVVKV